MATLFLYNGRIAFALIPIWGIIFTICGHTLALWLLACCAGAGLVNLLGMEKKWSLFTLLLGVVATNIFQLVKGAIIVSHSLGLMFLLLNNTIAIAATGMWIALQFKYTKELLPEVPLLRILERFLFVALPTMAVPNITWATVTIFVQLQQFAPWIFLVMTTVAYQLFWAPVYSSYSGKSSSGRFEPECLILTPLTSIIGLVYTCMAPVLFYISLNFWTMADIACIMNAVICLASPLVNLNMPWNANSLWFLRNGKTGSFGGMLAKVAASAMLCAVQHRLIFGPLYPQVAAGFPVSIGLVGVIMVGVIILAQLLNMSNPSKTDKRSATILGLVVSSCFAWLLDIHLVLKIFIVVACGAWLVWALFGGLPIFGLFVVSLVSSVVWYSAERLWFLRLSFGALEIPTSLLLLFVVMIVAAAAVLPVVMFGGIDSLKSYTGPLLLAWIALFSVTQYTLFSHGVYPILIVLATTTVSVAATVRLANSRMISAPVGWLSLAMCLSNLSIIVQASFLDTICTFLVLLPTLRLWLLTTSTSPMSSITAWVLVIFSGVSVGLSALQLIPGTLERVIGECAADSTMAVALLVWGIIVIPLGFTHIVSNSLLRLVNISVLFAGALVAFFQYALSAAEYSLSLGKLELGCMAILVFALISLLAGLPIGSNTPGSVLFSATVGVSSGVLLSSMTSLAQDNFIATTILCGVIFGYSLLALLALWHRSSRIGAAPLLFGLCAAGCAALFALSASDTPRMILSLLFAFLNVALGIVCTISVSGTWDAIESSDNSAFTRNVLSSLTTASTLFGYASAAIYNMVWSDALPIGWVSIAPILLLLWPARRGQLAALIFTGAALATTSLFSTLSCVIPQYAPEASAFVSSTAMAAYKCGTGWLSAAVDLVGTILLSIALGIVAISFATNSLSLMRNKLFWVLAAASVPTSVLFSNATGARELCGLIIVFSVWTHLSLSTSRL